MASGLWGALGAALQQGVGTYNDISQQEAQERERQAQRQMDQERMKLQQEQAKREAETFLLAQKDRRRAQLLGAIEGLNPKDIVPTDILNQVREEAPEYLTRLNLDPATANIDPTLQAAGGGMGAMVPNLAGLQLGPEQATRKATLQEQGQQANLDAAAAALAKQKADEERAAKIMDQLAKGTLKDTPANRALLSQYTKANPNEMWGSIEHPSRANAGRGSGGIGDVNGLAQAVIQNPALWETLTPTARTKLAPTLNAMGFDFTRGMQASGIKYMAEANAALQSANDLATALQNDKGDSTGAIQGYAGYLPDTALTQALFDTRDVKTMQSKIDLVKQRIGKLLEGGVLRMEDEKKYARILPTVFDSDPVKAAKMKNVIETLQSDIASYVEQQQGAGRRVPGFEGVSVNTDSGRGPAPAPEFNAQAIRPVTSREGASKPRAVGRFVVVEEK
jgi:hypothetical protein